MTSEVKVRKPLFPIKEWHHPSPTGRVSLETPDDVASPSSRTGKTLMVKRLQKASFISYMVNPYKTLPCGSEEVAEQDP